MSQSKENKQAIDLDNKEFQDVWKLLRFTNRSVFLTGRAGSGKSTFLRYIKSNIKKKHVVLAPTGIAAVNVGGVTIHSFFKLPLKPVLPDDPDFAISRLRERMKYNRRFIKLLQKLELIIIDEISMVRADTIDFIDKLLRVFCGNMRQPFAGKQLLLVGDIFQLEPVVSSEMRMIMRRHYSQPFFFHARAFDELGLVPVELQKVYRQKESAFIEILDRVRQGVATSVDLMTINSRVQPPAQPQEEANLDAKPQTVMTLATRRDIVDHINQSRLDEIRRPEFTFTGTLNGDFPETSLPTSLELVLKEGAQVLFVKNDRERRWVNGTIGRISKLAADLLEVRLDDGTTHVVEPETWSNIHYEYDEKTKRVKEKEVGSFIQYPLKPAWALTIHKSQGLTFDRVIVDIGPGTFASGQSYVALSRCTTLEGMTLVHPINMRDMVVNPAVIAFSRTFNDGLMIDDALQAAKADDLYSKSMVALGKGQLVESVDLWKEAMDVKARMPSESEVRLTRLKLHGIEAGFRKIDELRLQIEEYRKTLSELSKEYLEMGRDCADSGMIDAALANFEKALKLDGDSSQIHTEIGKMLEAGGDHAGAVLKYKRAAELEPDDPLIPCRIAAAFRSLDDNYNALDTLLEAVGRMPDSVDLHRSLAVSYRRAGEEDEAARHEAKARAIARRKKH